MQRRTIIPALSLLTLLASIPATGAAQKRRRTPDAAPSAPVRAPRADPRWPFAGLWTGSRSFRDGPGKGDGDELRLAFDVDSTGNYRGYAILPNNAHAPYARVAIAGTSLTWQQRNSGGGTWMYTARISAPDVLEGGMTLVDWPQGGGAQPVATFKLARQQAP